MIGIGAISEAWISEKHICITGGVKMDTVQPVVKKSKKSVKVAAPADACCCEKTTTDCKC